MLSDTAGRQYSEYLAVFQLIILTLISYTLQASQSLESALCQICLEDERKACPTAC